jgi:RNA recognition motif-containing protein
VRSTTHSDLESAFGRFGVLKRCVIRKNVLAFVDFADLQDAVTAKGAMNGSGEFGRRLIVEFQAALYRSEPSVEAWSGSGYRRSRHDECPRRVTARESQRRNDFGSHCRSSPCRRARHREDDREYFSTGRSALARSRSRSPKPR